MDAEVRAKIKETIKDNAVEEEMEEEEGMWDSWRLFAKVVNHTIIY